MEILGMEDTTSPSYWLNWRFLVCAIWVLVPMIVSTYIIWKYERSDHAESVRRRIEQEGAEIFCDEAWRPCLNEIHPVWLLVYRVIGFLLLLWTLISAIIAHGGSALYYYTQWTLVLIIIYFAFGSLLSVYGCHHLKMHTNVNVDNTGTDSEQGLYVPLTYKEPVRGSRVEHNLNPTDENHSFDTAAFLGLLFQVIFQMTAGAVMLTDSIYWFIIFPFLTIKDYDWNYLTVITHSLNVVMLLGDIALNCSSFPWFRISYFILWTGIYVIVQWIIHACVPLWWPYPFLDLSGSYAVLWYLGVALMHIPCYGVLGLVIKLKQRLYSRWFPQSYRRFR